MRKSIFTLKVAEHCNRLLGQVLGFLSLETFKIYLVIFLCDLLQVTCLGKGVGWDDIQWSFPAPRIL